MSFCRSACSSPSGFLDFDGQTGPRPGLGPAGENVRGADEIKLGVFGLDRDIDWEGGAYGEDSDLRPGLVDIALARSATAVENAVLVGDTPVDVEGGLATGVRVIAVATGRTSAEALRAAGAHSVLADLTDTEAFIKFVVDGS
ncbi:HAD family hydrolase [Streptomyces sp. NPDC059861]|uniref:HAD family hydrolase n=1 Tax=Streptomyces sp. NPDC059861 TaxID=3346974 RepID=UPI00365D9003